MHIVQVSQLSDSNKERIKTILDELANRMISAPTWKIVAVHSGQAIRLRKAPGANKLLEKLGPKSFGLFGAALSVGLNALSDSKRTDLTPSQRIGRTSVDILISLTPLGVLAFGLSLMYPDRQDYIKNWLFSTSSPHIQFIADQIVRLGGASFQEWSATPSWLDFI